MRITPPSPSDSVTNENKDYLIDCKHYHLGLIEVNLWIFQAITLWYVNQFAVI